MAHPEEWLGTDGVKRPLPSVAWPVRDGWLGLLRGPGPALALVAWLLVAPTPCRAAWPSAPGSNLPIGTLPLSQDLPQIISDGTGGVIIAWQAAGTDGIMGVYAQRIDREGRSAWGENGAAVCPLPTDQREPMLVPDSCGGAIVAWQDRRSGSDWKVFAQRIDRSGILRWFRDGVSLSGAAGDQLGPQLDSDGHGGAIIAWQDLRDDPNSDLYAQAVDSAGRTRWSVDGVPIFAGPGAQLLPQVITNGAGGVFVWRDSRGGGAEASIYAQRVDAGGSPLWGPSGVLLDDALASDAHPEAITDGRGGLIVAWESGPIHAQRLDVSGRPSWGGDGIVLSTADGSAPAIVSDGAGGAIVAWQTGSPEAAASDIRAQSVLATGTMRWGADGVAVCRSSGAQTEVAATRAGAGGVIVAWRDGRNDPFGDLYAQRVDSSGTALWNADGIVVSDAPGFQSALTICSDGSGGAVVAWTDGRAGRHIYAQRVTPRGRLGGVVNADHPMPRSRPGLPASDGEAGTPTR